MDPIAAETPLSRPSAAEGIPVGAVVGMLTRGPSQPPPAVMPAPPAAAAATKIAELQQAMKAAAAREDFVVAAQLKAELTAVTAAAEAATAMMGTAKRDECVVCLEGQQTHALVPCGHQCICISCVQHVTTSGCPICRTAVVATLRVFKSN